MTGKHRKPEDSGAGRISGEITAADIAQHDTRAWDEIPEAERVQLTRQMLKDLGLLTKKNGFRR